MEGRGYISSHRKVNVNADAFIKFILKPMIENDIPALYKEDAKNVVLHMNSTPTHTANKVTQWPKDRKLTYILKEE